MTALNPWDTDGIKHSRIEDVGFNREREILPGGFVVEPSRAEELISTLRKFKLEEVGSSEWMTQHQVLEKLNIQAHQCAMTNSDDFVTEAFVLHKQLDTIVHELIVIECWKEFVYPKVVNGLAGKNSMRLYFVLYHEATLTNLLEVMMFHKHVLESLEGEKWIEIVDYVARKLTRVNAANASGTDFRGLDPCNNRTCSAKPLSSTARTAKEIAEEIASRTPLEELSQHFVEIEFRICISACFLMRFLCEHADVLPISVHSRITDTHDFLVLIVPLIENPPWTRRNPDTKKWQKIIDYKWTEVLPIDLLKVTKLEGQLWITLYFLVSKREFRERYQLNSFRTAQLLRVRKYLNEILLDQLPMLSDIQRYMDELTISDSTSGGTAGKSALDAATLSANTFSLFQQVAILRDGLLRQHNKNNWETCVTAAVDRVFTMTDATDRDLKMLADVYADDLAEDVLEPLPVPQGNDYEDI